MHLHPVQPGAPGVSASVQSALQQALLPGRRWGYGEKHHPKLDREHRVLQGIAEEGAEGPA